MEKIDVISEEIENYFNITKEELFGKNRLRYIVEARQFFHFFSWKYTLRPLGKIGSYYGHNFTHATVIHSRKMIFDLMVVKRHFKKFNELNTIIKEAISNYEMVSKTENNYKKYICSKILGCKSKDEIHLLLQKEISYDELSV